MAKRTDGGKKTQNAGVGRAWISALRTEPLERLYIMYGEESYRRETAVGFIRQRLSPGGFDWDSAELRGRGVTLDAIAETVDTPPVSAERKLVLVRDFDPMQEEFLPIAASLPEDVCLVFDMENPAWKPDKRTKIYRELAKVGFFAEFNQAVPEELRGFIRRCFKDRGRVIEPEETEYLIFLCTNLMGGLLNEIEKIAAYAKDTKITRADIDAVASPTVEARIFDLCDELAEGRTGQALRILADLETARESAIAVTAVIARQFRQLYAVRMAQEARKSYAETAALAGINPQFQGIMNRVIQTARRIPLPLLRDMLLACMETDRSLKSSRAGEYDTLRMLLMRYRTKAAAL